MSLLKLVLLFLLATIATPILSAQAVTVEVAPPATDTSPAQESFMQLPQARPFARPFDRTKLSQNCNTGITDKHLCAFKWRRALGESLEFLAIQHYMNRGTYEGTLKGR